MPPKKKPQHKPTRLQPQRAARDPNRKDGFNAREPTTGVRKNAEKLGGPLKRQRKKLQQKKLQNALVKKVDARDPKDSWAEQAGLLGLTVPPSPKTTRPPATRPKKSERYVDYILRNEADDDPNDDLKRAERWIPDFEHRRRPLERPPGIPHAVWMAYKHLDELVYRFSLSREELVALPLLEDVHAYQDMDGRTERPITPPGFRWDDNLELEPLG
ncbi:hypothetical protein F4861DRAFT_514623 [Xylaria intraflava]|nr:hypothetical protein F4861DRAFT_514623 [Xylaria intraflava]